jgi:transposase InsO family protein
VRDEVVGCAERWAGWTGKPCQEIVQMIGISKSKFYQWRGRQGVANSHNGHVCRDHWLLPEEKQAIISYARSHPVDGYRRLTYMMMDEDVVAASPATVYRIMKDEGLLGRWAPKNGLRGRGFTQPERPHQHWHTDITHVRTGDIHCYLCSVIDGYSRAVIAWNLSPSMKQHDVQIVIQRAHERHPDEKPRVISDNGSQFVSREFKQLLGVWGMQHVRTSTYYPQSNGKIERWHGSLKSESLRRYIPMSLEDGQRIIGNYVTHYNTRRLHSATGYITPQDMLKGRQHQIHSLRDTRLKAAREHRLSRHLTARQQNATQLSQLEKRTQALEESNLSGISSCSSQPEQPANADCLPPLQRLELQNA